MINQFNPAIYNGPNLLNNPSFLVAQQGNGNFSMATGAATPNVQRLDDWIVSANGAGGVINYGRSSVPYPAFYGVLPFNPSYSFYMQLATIGAGQVYMFLAQKMEDVRILAGREVVISGWVSSTTALPASGSNGVNLKIRCDNAYGTGATPVTSTLGAEVAIDVPTANTWTYFECATTFPSIPSGLTLGANHYNMLYFVDWNVSTPHTVNFANLMLQVGRVAGNFNQAPYEIQLARAMRSYQQSFPYGTVPVQNIGNTVGAYTFSATNSNTGVNYGPSQSLIVPMRFIPTVTLYNPNAANGQIRNIIRNTDSTGGAVGGQLSEKQLIFQGSGATGWAISDRLCLHWSAYAYL